MLRSFRALGESRRVTMSFSGQFDLPGPLRLVGVKVTLTRSFGLLSRLGHDFLRYCDGP